MQLIGALDDLACVSARTDHQTIQVGKINAKLHHLQQPAIPSHHPFNAFVSTFDPIFLSLVILEDVRLWLGVYSGPFGPRPRPRHSA